jgi:hypothetical protein
MDRRKFLVGLAAVPFGAVAVAKSLSDEVPVTRYEKPRTMSYVSVRNALRYLRRTKPNELIMRSLI